MPLDCKISSLVLPFSAWLKKYHALPDKPVATSLHIRHLRKYLYLFILKFCAHERDSVFWSI